MFGPLDLRPRSREELDALASANGRSITAERVRDLALLVLVAGCLLAGFFVALTG
jgi:hypothetical protein